ncbi:hypothetical protein Y032_0094g2757 [Ancylostoma ceylanicum]|uniref:CRIB domain-containing protein n=1 Tax=Ancylostoma ceylanicum TaxID=53326 RepID=A0A016TLB3_9BILA|nr:hypothetical protein Y032_0094g2757 [Ancylostoma ceylanicum]
MPSKTSGAQEGDDTPRTPTPAPRRLSVKNKKPTISAPFNFRHVSHFGLGSSFDHTASEPLSGIEEVGNHPQASSKEGDDEQKTTSHMRRVEDATISDDDLEKLGAAALHVPQWSSEVLEKKESAKPETIACTFEVCSVPTTTPANPKSSSCNVCSNTSPTHAKANEGFRLQDDVMPKVDVSWHQNVTTVSRDAPSAQHRNESSDDNSSAMHVQQSKKKNPAPPPPSQSQAPGNLPNRDENVAWKPNVCSAPPKAQSAHIVKTSEKVEQHCTVSSSISRPNVLGDMNTNLDHIVTSPSSSRTPTMTPSSHSSPRNVGDKARRRLPQWMIDMPVKDQKRLNGVWLAVMGETEMPDDRRTVMETVAKFEAQGGCVSPQRHPVPRRIAPPPPTGHILKRAEELNEGIRRSEGIASPCKEQGSSSSHSAVLETVQSAASTPSEKINSPAMERPIPKPRKKKSVDKPKEECIETVCIGTPVIVLPEQMTECVVTVSKPRINVSTSTCILKDYNGNSKGETTELAVDGPQKDSPADSNGRAPTGHDTDTDSDEDVETIRF